MRELPANKLLPSLKELGWDLQCNRYRGRWESRVRLQLAHHHDKQTNAMLATRWNENGLRRGFFHVTLKTTDLPIKPAMMITGKKERRNTRNGVSSYCETSSEDSSKVSFVNVVVLLNDVIAFTVQVLLLILRPRGQEDLKPFYS